MTPRILLTSLVLALCACGGSAETAEAPPGAVERTTEALARNEAAEQKATIRKIDREAEVRAEASKDRIEAIERNRSQQD